MKEHQHVSVANNVFKKTPHWTPPFAELGLNKAILHSHSNLFCRFEIKVNLLNMKQDQSTEEQKYREEIAFCILNSPVISK